MDWFPALNIKYSLNEKTNFRLAASRTISRPEFKEMAPFLYTERFNSRNIIGNPNLQNAFNYNFDLKYEVFPDKGELFAVSVFGKYLQKPY